MSKPSTSPSSSDSPTDERRKHPRATVGWSAHIALEQGFTEVQLRDISVAGACFFSERPFPELTMLGLHLDIPDSDGGSRSLDSRGVVVRCQKISAHLDHYEVAVFLNELAADERAAIARYVGGRNDA